MPEQETPLKVVVKLRRRYNTLSQISKDEKEGIPAQSVQNVQEYTSPAPSAPDVAQ